GATVVEQFVERGFDGATGKKHVVHQNHGRAVHVGRDGSWRKLLGNRIATDVVAMKGDIESAHFGRVQPFGDAAGEGDAAVGDPEQNQVGSYAMAFGNGLGEPVDG